MSSRGSVHCDLHTLSEAPSLEDSQWFGGEVAEPPQLRKENSNGRIHTKDSSHHESVSGSSGIGFVQAAASLAPFTVME